MKHWKEGGHKAACIPYISIPESLSLPSTVSAKDTTSLSIFIQFKCSPLNIYNALTDAKEVQRYTCAPAASLPREVGFI